MSAAGEDRPSSFQPVAARPSPGRKPQPAAPAARRPAGPAPGPLLIATAVLAAAVWIGLRHAGLEPGWSGAAGGLVAGLILGAALPGWCQRLGDRLGISKQARRRQ
ncbi:hypothetical protein [Nonomuraea typhae]|uniref:hypothetical protein n=1 Tax=Nonomuraea typhae TaxID=2603600 RepID=UPI0012F8D876|nr:hypothetical protein [Nonomuraea typhae]